MKQPLESPESEQRFFLTQDDDCHWFVVPIERRAEWENWQVQSFDGDPEPPDFAKPVGGSPSLVTFTSPRLRGVGPGLIGKPLEGEGE